MSKKLFLSLLFLFPISFGLLYVYIFDPFSPYISGIGIEIEPKEGHFMVIRLVRGMPAERAGLKVKNEIASVNGKEVFGLTLDQVVKKITGPEGTVVQIRYIAKNPRTGVLQTNTTKIIRQPIPKIELEKFYGR